MKPHLVIVGGGFAGLWATAAARARGRDELEVTLITAVPDLTIRPRLYEADVEATRVPLEPIVSGLGARLQVATVTGIDTDRRDLQLGAERVRADAVVLAAGSVSPLPPIPGLAEHGQRIDTLDRAAALRALLARGAPGQRRRVTVVGGGLTGVELATELASERGVAVTLLDAGRIGDGFGPEGQAIVRGALAEVGVRLVDGARLESVSAGGAMTSLGPIDHDVLVWCGGLRANPLTNLVPVTLDELGRLPVDRELRVDGIPGLWAAGDVARTSPDGVHVSPMSCQFAIPTGRVAGHNAAVDLLGGSGVPFEVERYVTCVDLGAAGALFTTGWNRTPRQTGAEAKATKRFINLEAIRPPSDAAVFLAAADPAADVPVLA